MIGCGAGQVAKEGAYLLFGLWLLYVLAVMGSSSLGIRLVNALPRALRGERADAVASAVIYMGIFVIAVAFLVTDTFNPFLYFRF